MACVFDGNADYDRSVTFFRLLDFASRKLRIRQAETKRVGDRCPGPVEIPVADIHAFGLVTGYTEYSYFLHRFWQRERSFVLEQDDTVRSRFPRQRGVCLEIRRFRISITLESRGFDNQFQNAGHAAVQVFFGQFSFLDL